MLPGALMVLTAARVWPQFTMPPPAEPFDSLPPSAHPLPSHSGPVPAAEECTLRNNDVYFSNYTSGQSKDKDDAMGMSLYCNEPVRVLISASPSPESPSFEYRLLRHEGGDSATLRYQLYIDWSRQVVWGDGTAESRPFVINVDPDAGAATVDVFGTIFANQSVPPGRYSDMVTVTIDVE
ncbi:SCPU domain-containing protein [Dyella monticola]|uniref:SCPU domain-containing protein n=1 Tax=Dyella monticola TaxID=1927958 RepID=A0A370X3Z2_9GAMM|nr:spore coat U domain-containing protein [Dyella monticola]RDS83108.1 SCPU domain-containing protein [Dyella monticola]